jgi:DNA processing protein
MPNVRALRLQVSASPGRPKKLGPYAPPHRAHQIGLWRALDDVRFVPPAQYDRLLVFGAREHEGDEGGPPIYFAGDLDLVRSPCVAVVGTRKVTRDGAALASAVACALVDRGIVVVSGLAEGVDTAALQSAIDSGGRVIAVIGTPLDRAYPAKNAQLQELIHREHLLVSPFRSGATVTKLNFPQRNKFMAALSDATVIIEASDTSGTLHQASECTPSRLDRWLFISQLVLDNKDVSWPAKFLSYPKTRVFETPDDIFRSFPLT